MRPENRTGELPAAALPGGAGCLPCRVRAAAQACPKQKNKAGETIMNQEQQFAKTLEEIKQLARQQGNCISEEQVKEAFAPLGFDDKQLEMVYDYLKTRK